jgi:hypothetical protein
VKSMRQLLRKTLECNCLDLEGCGRHIQRVHAPAASRARDGLVAPRARRERGRPAS